MKQGRLITFEGIEGCGKSTQMQRLSAWLSQQSVPHICTREPGGTEAGSQIRRILLSEQTARLEPLSEVMLYLADRFQHIKELIRPHLSAGDVVLCDRYHDSTVAYQGYARGLSLEWIDRVWKESGMAAQPDLTFLLDVAPEIGIERSLRKLSERKLDESRFERESLEFHTRVREGFLDLARRDTARFRVIDAAADVDFIHAKVIAQFEQSWSVW